VVGYGVRIPPGNARESEWCKYLASRLRGNPRQEVRLSKRLWCDIVTNTHAWEVDKAKSLREGVMQAIEYGHKAGLHPSLILLYDPMPDQGHVDHVREERNRSHPGEPAQLPEAFAVGRMDSTIRGRQQATGSQRATASGDA